MPRPRLSLVALVALVACSSGKDGRPDPRGPGGTGGDTDLAGSGTGATVATGTGGPTGTGTGTGTGATGTGTGSTATDRALQFVGAPPRNLLFVSIDTFRKDHLGAYGDLGLTPFLDTISASGFVLENHVQCSDWTYGSTTCTLLGRTNVENGHLPRLNGRPDQRLPVPDGTPFLASWLGDAGFYNLIACGNSWLGRTWGNTQGYHEEHRVGGGALTVGRAGMNALLDAKIRGDVGESWFLHVHFLDPHASYDPGEEWVEGIEDLPPWPEDLRNRDNHYRARDDWHEMTEEDRELLEAHLRALYAGEIRRMDERIRTLWSELDAAGLLDDTLVVIWNDHGEQFWEHGDQTHAFRLHREENDGIAVFWAKNIVPGRWSGYTSAIDLAPTVLDLWGIPIPDVVSGVPVGEAPLGRAIFAEALARRGGQQSVVVDGLKLHYSWSGVVQLYDRNVDPEELTDLYDPTDPRVLDLWGRLRPMVDRMAPLPVDGPAPTYPPDLP